MAIASPAHAEGVCGNWAFNISRASECLSYTTDRQVQDNLRDKRMEAINEFADKNPNAGEALNILIKEGDRRMTHALSRDLGVFPDKDMYKSRGCAELPVCVAKIQQSVDVPRKVPTETIKPTAPARVNTRTGGKWCGPRDRRAGYCNWKGWLK
jgi:hypothetical protein